MSILPQLCSSVKTLGEAQEDEDASSWVDKMRRKDEENKRTEEMVTSSSHCEILLMY